MKAPFVLCFILVGNIAFASIDVNPTDSISEDETMEVGDVKTSTCSAHVAMGDTSEVEVSSESSSESVEPNASRQ